MGSTPESLLKHPGKFVEAPPVSGPTAWGFYGEFFQHHIPGSLGEESHPGASSSRLLKLGSCSNVALAMSKQVTLNRMFGVAGPQTAGEYPHLCLECGQSFKTVQALFSHQRWFHPDARSSSEPSSISFPAPLPVDKTLVAAAAKDDGEDLSVVEEKDGGCDDDTKGRKKRRDGQVKETRGADKRKRLAPWEILEAMECHEHAVAVLPHKVDENGKAVGTDIPYTTLFKQNKAKARLLKQASKELQEKLTTPRRSWMRSNELVQILQRKLLDCVVACRKKKKPVTSTVALIFARSLYVKLSSMHPDKGWPAVRRTKSIWSPSKKWVAAWLVSKGFAKRKASKKRNTTAEADSAAMQRYADKLRFVLQQPPDGDVESVGSLVYGHFAYDRRFNMDSVSLPFDVSAQGSTWASADERASGIIHIRGGRSGWEKRQATWHVCMSADPDGPHPSTAIIFRGVGHVTEVEKLSYDPDVHVLWQRKAWLDRNSLDTWLQEVWGPFVRHKFVAKEPLLLVCDAVDAQRRRSFKNELAKVRTTHFLGEPTFTHVWQTVDRHTGKILKNMYSDIQLEYLTVDENWDKYVSLKTWERRVLMTQWVGEAWRRFRSDMRAAHVRFAECSGLRIRLDNVGDEKITVEANPAFKVQPFHPWEGLPEQLEAAYIEDVDHEIEVLSGSASDSSSGSESGEEPLIDVDAAVDEADVGGSGDLEAAAAAPAAVAAAAAVLDVELATVDDIVRQLSIAKGRGKLKEAVAFFRDRLAKGQPIGYPKSIAKKMLSFEVLEASIKEVSK